MKRYCFDTSGLSNPLETMPDDIHQSMWVRIEQLIASGAVAVTLEIYREMEYLTGRVGTSIRSNKSVLVLEVGDDSWNWRDYVSCVNRMQATHHSFISEYNGGSPRTICLNDLSIVALAKTLALPVVSMESPVPAASISKRRIPNVCSIETVQHLTFSEFLRHERIRI